jgi:hypothetical protein
VHVELAEACFFQGRSSPCCARSAVTTDDPHLGGVQLLERAAAKIRIWRQARKVAERKRKVVRASNVTRLKFQGGAYVQVQRPSAQQGLDLSV